MQTKCGTGIQRGARLTRVVFMLLATCALSNVAPGAVREPPGVAVTNAEPLLAAHRSLQAVTFAEVSANLPGVCAWPAGAPRSGLLAWGDYDNDGDLDVLLRGGSHTGGAWTGLSLLCRNDAAGAFVPIDIGLPQTYSGGVTWGDYDNDGDLDILLSGVTAADTYVSCIFRNEGNDAFTDIQAGLTAVQQSAVAWADYDNDGDLDILLAGALDQLPEITYLYRNEGTGGFVKIADLPGVRSGSPAWGDYDNDGDLDLLLAGALRTQIYRNDGGGVFAEAGAGLEGISKGTAAWGDYDSDGDLDILLVGDTATYAVAHVYRNDGEGVFVNISAGLTGITGSAAWGDYDNDGDLDVLVAGQEPVNVPVSRVYRNDSGVFSDVSAGLVKVSSGRAVWGDYDRDGDLDIVLAGIEAGTDYPNITRLYRSLGAPANTPPSVPTGLTTQVEGEQVTLGWAPSTDAQTPTPGLSYNLRVGTTPAGSEIVSPMADAATGYRRVVQLGNAQQRTSWTLHLSAGQYYWSVQAIDGAFAGSAFAPEQSFRVIAFYRGGAVLPGLRDGSLGWGDYDSDGDLDLLMTGTTDNGATNLARVCRNEGGEAFAEAGAGLPGVRKSAVAWGDYDNDGDVDLALTGSGDAGLLSAVYRNEGSGAFVDLAAGLPGLYESAVAWGDYDNDGNLDLAVTGRTGADTCLSRLYRNDGDGTFREIPAGLPGVHRGCLAWGDYDSDGDLDLFLAGRTGAGTYLSELYHNEGSGAFTPTEVSFPGLEYGSAAWGDWDADGDLDLLLTGHTDVAPWYVTRIYRNEGGGVLTDLGADLPGADGGTGAWGDYDNDGDLDILLTGWSGFERLARVYRNDGGGVFALGDVLLDEVWGPAAWGDYDNDGDLDVALAGESAMGYVASLYRNDGAPANLSPSPPGGLTAQVVGDEVTLSWEAATDDHTPVAGLSYNVRVGTTPGGSEVVSAQASAADGYRRVVQLGNAQQRTWCRVKLPGPGSYYWSVQAVDGAYAASAFAPEENLVAVPALASLVSVEARTDGVSLTWFAADSPGALATVYRRTEATDWAALAEILADGTGYLRYEDRAVEPGTRYAYRLGLRVGGSETFASEVWAEVPREPLVFALESIRPNPSVDGELTVHCTLPSAEPARLELLDIRGRRLAEERLNAPGSCTLQLGHRIRLAPGVYVVRLSQGTKHAAARAAVVR